MVYPNAKTHVNEKVLVLKETLSTVSKRWNLQRQAMEEGQVINELQEDYSELMGWISTMISAITCNDLTTSYTDGVYQLQKHDAIYRRISDYDSSFQDIWLRLDTALTACPRKSKEISIFISNLKHRHKVSANG